MHMSSLSNVARNVVEEEAAVFRDGNGMCLSWDEMRILLIVVKPAPVHA
jgi:hypothetical protein